MRIVLCYPVEPRHVEQIHQVAGSEAEVVDAGQERIAELLGTADIFCGHCKVPVPWPEVVSRGRLQWIQSSAAGMDHCLVPSVIDSSIPVTSASGLFADPVAEQTMALLLGLHRGFPIFFRQQQQHVFTRQPTRDLHDKTVGIVGFGGNGRRIAEVLAPYRVRIVATDRFPPQTVPPHVDVIWPADRLGDLLEVSDIVILCVPLNHETEGMFGPKQFDSMRRGITFINVARGQVVQEGALVSAIDSGQVAAAGLDVTEIEPLPANSPLWDKPQVIITPHVGAQSSQRVDKTTDFFCENLRRFLSHRPLKNLVDKRLGFPIPSAEH